MRTLGLLLLLCLGVACKKPAPKAPATTPPAGETAPAEPTNVPRTAPTSPAPKGDPCDGGEDK